MNRRIVEVVVVASVAILVVSIAASTLDSTTTVRSGDGVGGGNGSGFLPEVTTNVSASSGNISLPRLPLVVVSALGMLFALWYLWNNPRDVTAILIGTAVLFGILILVLLFLGKLFGGGAGGTGTGLLGGGGGQGGLGGSSPTGVMFQPRSIELIGVLVLGIVFVGVVLGVSGRELGAGGETEEQEEEEPTVDVDAIARTAGRAANRIAAQAEVENEVYRAWQEMTDLLDVPDPETSTPREFASAAIDAGMDPDDVDRLTRLFEEVRYGEEEPTEDREQRAIAAFRRIESTYGADE